jgi:hypothetical protein
MNTHQFDRWAWGEGILSRRAACRLLAAGALGAVISGGGLAKAVPLTTATPTATCKLWTC